MSRSPNTVSIVRVREVLGRDTVIVAEVADSLAGGGRSDRFGRSLQMAQGGVDTFWRIRAEAEAREGKACNALGASRWPGLRADNGQALIEGKSVAFPLSVTTNVFKPASHARSALEPYCSDILDIKDAVRLLTGYRPPSSVEAAPVDSLIVGTLESPLRRAVDAIELAPGEWIRASDYALRSGCYRVNPDIAKSAFPVWSIASGSRPIDVGNGIVIFSGDNVFEREYSRDYRSEDEVYSSAGQWLERIAKACDEDTGGRAQFIKLSEIIQSIYLSTCDEKEIKDLSATFSKLERRAELVEMLPKILERAPSWSERIEELATARIGLIVEKFEADFAVEVEEKRRAASELDDEIFERRNALAVIGERERAYRDVIATLDQVVSTRVDAELRAMRLDTLAATKTELLELKENLQELSRGRDRGVEPENKRIEGILPFADRTARLDQLRNLGRVSSTSVEKVTLAVSLASCGILPVFVGPGADRISIEIGKCISGDNFAAMFCDPTIVSVRDVVSDGVNSISRAVAVARSKPDTTVAAVLCGINKAPCEFWLPGILNGWRTTLLPENLIFFASASADGIRVPLPQSLLPSIVPFEIPGASGRMPLAEGLPWPLIQPTPADSYKELRGAIFDALDIPDRTTRSLVGELCGHADAVGVENHAGFIEAMRSCVEWWSNETDVRSRFSVYFTDGED